MTGWHGPYGVGRAPADPFWQDLIAASTRLIDPASPDDRRLVFSFRVADPTTGEMKPLASYPVEDLGGGMHRRGSFVYSDVGKLDLGIIREETRETDDPIGWVAAAAEAIREQLPPRPAFRWQPDAPYSDLSRQILAVTDIRIRQGHADEFARALGVPPTVLPETQEAIDAGWLVAPQLGEEFARSHRDPRSAAIPWDQPGSDPLGDFRRAIDEFGEVFFIPDEFTIPDVPEVRLTTVAWIADDGWRWWEHPRWVWRPIHRIIDAMADRWPDP